MNTIKKIILCLILLLCKPYTIIHASNDVYVEDTYGVLTEEETNQLQKAASEVSNHHQFAVYARIIQDDSGESYDYMDSYIEDYYENNNLGYGDTSDGVLLLITFTDEGGSYQVYIPGNANQEMFTLDGMDQMDDVAYQSLKQHDYYQAINDYIEKADSLMNYYETNGEAYGSNYDYDSEYYSEVEDDDFMHYLPSFIAPPVIGLIVVLVLKSKHKTKHIAVTANNYVPRNGLHLTNRRDMFLYQTVTRTPIPKDDDHHGGGSSPGGSHFSSSGGMHSGGGHF